ncbi:MAG: T9SS type A sorting domain-containing protein [Bacteroidales bacterium]|nr:T9SS type A sorting domain-containing protein [Bacteroidales bacterium]
MKKLILIIILISIIPYSLISQTYSKDKTVIVSASINASAPSISLHWLAQDSTISYDIFKKSPNSESWTTQIASSLPAGTLSFTDTNVKIGEEYEYIVVRNYLPSNNKGYGFILSGIEKGAIYNHGILLLVVDSLSTRGLDFEIKRWIDDTEADGWVVKTLRIDSNDQVTSIKSAILTLYDEDPENTKALFLLGRVPVPYSGNLCPDGHPDHVGAWPADGYYADVDGNWTDESVNSTSSGKARTINTPGDGKFDQSVFYSPVDLQIGRVDMRNLLLYTKSETTLLKQYLDKNHAYKNKYFVPRNRGLIRDNFIAYPEGFAASAFNSFYTLCDSVDYNIGYSNVLSKNDYQWAYGCGGGSYTSCSGVITSTFLASDTLMNVFNFLFGSYFGDWDNTNNLLRSTLASGSLSIAWSGRPFWYVHQMAMGYNIGYCAKLTMNNQNTYYPGNIPKGVHIALLGDPSLRAHILSPPSNVIATFENKQCRISWQKSTDEVDGYYVFKRLHPNQAYTLVSPSIIKDTLFIDRTTSETGTYQYMVRAVGLHTSPSGSYYNLSLGKIDTAFNHQAFVSIADVKPLSTIKIYPNPAKHILTIENNEYLIKVVYIYDMLGKEITRLQTNNHKVVLNIQHINPGIYVLKTNTEQGTFNHKIHIIR